MTEKNDPAREYLEAVESDAAGIADHVMSNVTGMGRDVQKRAAELLVKRFAEEADKNSPEGESRRLGNLNQNEFRQELKEKYGIW